MRAKSTAKELSNEVENDLAMVMLIEKRHASKIGMQQARDLIERVKRALSDTRDEENGELARLDHTSNVLVH